MARDTVNTKCRLCRREGTKLFLKGDRCLSAKCPLEKKGAVPPGMHGIRSYKRLSNYGEQLRAKQRIKRSYGVLETQLKNYYLQAKRMSGVIGDNLLSLLERRLDNVVYTAGLSQSRCQAKQFVSHKKIFVNGKVLNINSYLVKIGDVISHAPTLSTDKTKDLKCNQKDFKLPDWLAFDNQKSQIKVVSFPKRDDVQKDINEHLVIEYYSR